MDKSGRLEEQWYSFYSAHGKHEFINELGNAYYEEGYADTLEEGFEMAEDYIETLLKYY